MAIKVQKKQTVNAGQGKNSAQKMCAEKRTKMARGQRKSIEEKIVAKQELMQFCSNIWRKRLFWHPKARKDKSGKEQKTK